MLFERPGSGERAVLVHIDFAAGSEKQDPQEFIELVQSAGAKQVAWVTGKRPSPHARFFVGTGKLEEIRADVAASEADLVVFNHSLSPGQERNLEKELCCRVVDRTGLILDIFAQRARTHEGKLQVELAQLQHMSTRLIRGWTHLERQKGGIGLRGPGETQLESDRRLLRDRIKSINKRLAKVRLQREQGRRTRQRADVPLIALVGYTNAGKSTLFNKWTQAEVYAADQLFATLDPTLRQVAIPHLGDAVLADTVGFIRHLPHKLVESFKATLEEVSNANLLLHVIDAADDEKNAHIEQVELVLNEIDALDLPRLEVFNKIDSLSLSPRIDRDETGRPCRVWLSAQTGEGIELLSSSICELLANDVKSYRLQLPPQQGRLRAQFYQRGVVVQESNREDGGVELSVRMEAQDFQRLVKGADFTDYEELKTVAAIRPSDQVVSSEPAREFKTDLSDVGKIC